MNRVYWYIGVYAKTGKQYLIDRIETVGVDSEFIRRVWSLPEDDPGWGRCWDVTPENLAEVQEHALKPLDLSAFYYELCDEPLEDS